jgi:hypothetical protein
MHWVLIRRACTVQVAAKDAITETLKTEAGGIAPAYRRLLKTLTSTANSARTIRGLCSPLVAVVAALTVRLVAHGEQCR